MTRRPPIVLVAGARPNFVKIAPLMRALQAEARPFRPVLVHTGQHYDAAMSQVFFDELGIPAPDVSLDAGSGSHAAQTARVLERFEKFLASMDPRPVGVVVVGDVNSTLACALAAVKLGIRVAHVEAGLRSFDRTMPEELNRVVTDAIADLLLVSEESGLENLRREGVPDAQVAFTGNVMIDTLVHQLGEARRIDVRQRYRLDGADFALVTLHRPANVDDADRLRAIAGMLARISRRLRVVWPIHPRTRRHLEQFEVLPAMMAEPSLQLMEPIGYREMLALMQTARVVLTDSGGVQEETTYLQVPCITLRPSTERPATVTVGTNTIAGTDVDLVHRLVGDVLDGRYKHGGAVPGWDGRAADRIVAALTRAWAA